jgi:hypothetical protein
VECQASLRRCSLTLIRPSLTDVVFLSSIKAEDESRIALIRSYGSFRDACKTEAAASRAVLAKPASFDWAVPVEKLETEEDVFSLGRRVREGKEGERSREVVDAVEELGLQLEDLRIQVRFFFVWCICVERIGH